MDTAGWLQVVVNHSQESLGASEITEEVFPSANANDTSGLLTGPHSKPDASENSGNAPLLAHPCYFGMWRRGNNTLSCLKALKRKRAMGLDGKCMLAYNNEGLLPKTLSHRRVVRGFSIQSSPVSLQHSGVFQIPTAPRTYQLSSDLLT